MIYDALFSFLQLNLEIKCIYQSSFFPEENNTKTHDSLFWANLPYNSVND